MSPVNVRSYRPPHDDALREWFEESFFDRFSEDEDSGTDPVLEPSQETIGSNEIIILGTAVTQHKESGNRQDATMANELISLAASPGTGNSYHSSPVPTLLACVDPHCVVQGLRDATPLSPPHPTNLSAVIVRKTERNSLPLSTAWTKRKAQEFGRLDSRSFPRRVRRSTRGMVDFAPAPTNIQRSVLPGASIDHEGNALTQNKQKSSTIGFEDKVPRGQLVPDHVRMSGQGPLPSQPTAVTQTDNGEPKQTRSKTGKYKCDVCDDEFGRKYEWRQHFVTDRHLKQAALGTDEEAQPKPRPFACMKGGCTECYGRKDEVLRHVRRRHPEVKLPPKRVRSRKGKRDP